MFNLYTNDDLVSEMNMLDKGVNIKKRKLSMLLYDIVVIANGTNELQCRVPSTSSLNSMNVGMCAEAQMGAPMLTWLCPCCTQLPIHPRWMSR